MNEKFFDQYDVHEDEAEIQFSDNVKLPFPNLRLHWWNFGDPRLLKIDESTKKPLEPNNIQTFGGWFSASEKYLPAVTAIGSHPQRFATAMMHPKSNAPFEASTNRIVYVAYIAHREGWFPSKNGKDFSKIDVLCLLGDYLSQDGIFKPYGPVVLSAQSLTAKAVKTAFNHWTNISMKARIEANRQPGSRFFVPIGSYNNVDENGGVTVHTERRGQGAESSIVTPPRLREPKEINHDLLYKLFIAHNRETLNQVREYKELAQPWIKDMAVMVENAKKAERERDAIGAARVAGRNCNNGPAEQTPTNDHTDDEIPF